MPAQQYIQSNEIRSANFSEQEVRDYTGIYRIRDGVVYKNNQKLNGASKADDGSILNKIGDDLYYVSNGVLLVYTLAVEKETELLKIPDSSMVFASGNGYLIFDNRKLTDERGMVIKDNIRSLSILYNALVLESSDGLSVVSLLTGKAEDCKEWGVGFKMVDGIGYISSGDKTLLTIKP